ncbi:MAG TPA: phage tail tip lysozyme [Streptosporangiaceae bacterium]|nr:phage tail tip lysozyme [Streptosporangiaceae bacterium]
MIGLLAGVGYGIADFTSPAAATSGTSGPGSSPAPAPGQQLAAGLARRPAAVRDTRSRPRATPSASARPRHRSRDKPDKSRAKPAATTVSCSGSGGLLPDNYEAIVQFMIAHGYSHNAAAGMAGNIYQESKGNPESVGMGGGGLIGWTPLPAGFVTGNPSADLDKQLSEILVYNQGWAQYIPALNAASSPAAAADIYVTDFERAGIPAASTREASANAVAAACKLLAARAAVAAA